jgi:hypothetical protein
MLVDCVSMLMLMTKYLCVPGQFACWDIMLVGFKIIRDMDMDIDL